MLLLITKTLYPRYIQVPGWAELELRARPFWLPDWDQLLRYAGSRDKNYQSFRYNSQNVINIQMPKAV